MAANKNHHNASKTHCKNGHELIGYNVVKRGRHRGCRACAVQRKRDARAQKKLTHVSRRLQPWPIEKRLLANMTVDAVTGCWVFGNDSYDGYGAIHLRCEDGKRRPRPAHRESWKAFVGPIPPGLVIDHLCANKRCINTKHMELVTIAENSRRGSHGRPQPVKTHCPNGHEYTQSNTKTEKRTRWHDGAIVTYRRCRTCQRNGKKAHVARARSRTEGTPAPM